MRIVTTLDLDVGNGEKLHLLVDSGADISLLKSKTLLGTAEFEPSDRVRVKSVEGSVIETHGSTETNLSYLQESTTYIHVDRPDKKQAVVSARG